MTADYDDPATEEVWCAERLAEVGEYPQPRGCSSWPHWRVAGLARRTLRENTFR
jgi:hypothetical protein